ncbi:hypothetical protein [Halosimplex halobium]|uniref:hypothetical protein n=1 Tax=Halosimplex halobium TaxID=3396618 RepID=UPI003F56FC00
MIRIDAPRRFAHGQALGRLEQKEDEKVDADDERIDEMLQAPVEDVELEQYEYSSSHVQSEPTAGEQVAVVENREGIRWHVSHRNIDSENVPEHVRRAARLALD